MPIWERVPKDMIERYRTVRRSGEKEIVIKKSRFIGHIMLG